MIDQVQVKGGQIAMWVADPGFATDQRIVDAFNFAIAKGCTHYFPSQGFDENILPRSIARYYESTYEVKIDPLTDVKVTHGAQEALSFAIHTNLTAGDEMIVPEPSYSALIEKLPIFGVRARFVPLIEEDDWRLDVDEIRSAINDKTKMIFICNPNNPTGIVYPKKDLEEIGSILRENRHVSVLLDECYSRILYDNTDFYSLIENESLRNQIYLVNSFSKAYAMTGWRLGYVISNKDRIDKIKAHAFEYNGGVSYAVQYAGAVALDQCSSFVDSMVTELDKRRHTMLQSLSNIPKIHFERPQGGFELFPDFHTYGSNSVELSLRLERVADVKSIPGVRFGPSGEGHLRLVFCSENQERIAEGIRRISEALK